MARKPSIRNHRREDLKTFDRAFEIFWSRRDAGQARVRLDDQRAERNREQLVSRVGQARACHGGIGDHARLELAGFKFNLCVSFDLIDVAEPVEWDDLRLDWREDALPELARLRDRTIDTVRIVEDREWEVNGLQFCSGHQCVEIFNALDELGITDAPEPDPDIVRVDI